MYGMLWGKLLAVCLIARWRRRWDWTDSGYCKMCFTGCNIFRLCYKISVSSSPVQL